MCDKPLPTNTVKTFVLWHFHYVLLSEQVKNMKFIENVNNKKKINLYEKMESSGHNIFQQRTHTVLQSY